MEPQERVSPNQDADVKRAITTQKLDSAGLDEEWEENFMQEAAVYKSFSASVILNQDEGGQKHFSMPSIIIDK